MNNNKCELDSGTSNIGIIWPSDNITSADIINELATTCSIVQTFSMNFFGTLRELIFDVYSYKQGLKVHSATNILEKINRLESKTHSNVTFILYTCDSFQQTIDAKKSIREKFKGVVSRPEFDIMHAADNIKELEHIQNIVLSKPNLDSYNIRTKMSSNLSAKLKVLDTWLNDNKVSKDDVCVVGGAVMDFYGYKLCDDIDIVLSDKIRNKYTDDGAKELIHGLDVVRANYSKKLGIGNWYTDNQLIYDKDLYVFSRGFKFAKLEIVKQRKAFSKRKKDIEDLNRIDNRPMLETFSPRQLIFPNRLDIACKYLLFKELESPNPDQFIIDLYKKHIMKRTGGRENPDKRLPNQPKKTRINSYMKSAKQIMDSMKRNGFDKRFPIPFYDNGIENGAHRIACALYLDIDVIGMKITPKKYKTWDRKWFEANDFAEEEIQLLETTLRKLLDENSITR
jgi:hypothetical protein